MKLANFLLVLLMLVIFKQHNYAQQINFRHYSVTEGLPSSTIRAIIQDSKGYKWFGSKNGLSRFDGYTFKNFQNQPNNPQSIGNNFIHCITPLDNNHLLIGTENGVYQLDLQTEIFTSFLPLKGKTVLDILKDKQGNLWIATRLNGLFFYEFQSQKIQNFIVQKNNRTVSSNQISKLAQDNLGNIWIGTLGAGIDIYNFVNKQFSSLNSSNSNLSANHINTIYKGLDGAIWIGTMNGGLCKWNAKANTFYCFQYNETKPFSMKDNIVRSVLQTKPNELMVGTERGLHFLDIATGKITVYTHQDNNPTSISDNAIYSICADQNKTVWVGTFFGGVNSFNESASAFELFSPNGNPNAISGKAVSSFLEQKPGEFWVGTEDAGLHYFNANTKKFLKYPFSPYQQKLSYHNIHALTKDKKGNIWVGIFAGGVNMLNPQTGSVKYFKQNPQNSQSLSSNNVFSLYEDKDGEMWAGTDKGLNKIDQQKGFLDNISQKYAANTIVYDIYEDNSKKLWLATYNNGLVVFNKKTKTWNRIIAGSGNKYLASNKLTCLADDHNGNLWVGSDGGGLHKFNFQTQQIKLYNTQLGIKANVIYGLQQDDSGQLWVSTNDGLYVIDLATDKVKHYTAQDNLQGQQFNYKALYKANDGKLLAGGIMGFNSFYPEKIIKSKPISSVTFTNFQLFNSDVLPAQTDSPLQKQIAYTDEIELSHSQSVMGFEFSVLNAIIPEKISYAYKMDGFDDDWNYIGNQHKAIYTNLSPGKYIFKVKATNDDNNWDVPEKTIQIVINPPFYRSILAYILYFLLLGVILYLIYKYANEYINRQNQAKLERLKNQEEQDFYTRKIEFFTEMAHEIRTPLSLIIAPLEKLLELNKWDNEEMEQLKVMDENADRLLNLVNQLLDFRRIESDAYTIHKEEIELLSLVRTVYSRFSSLQYKKDLEFTLTSKTSSLQLLADSEVINKVLSNLLINAFKFARSSVNITVNEVEKTSEGEGVVTISVQDDGIGIPTKDLKNIFKKFFTTKSSNYVYHNHGGTGIGLALACSLAEKHGGRLYVESVEGERTVFTFELPIEGELNIPAKVDKNEIVQNDLLNAPTILLVDDDASMLDFIAKSFRSETLNVITATNGKEALLLLANNHADIIVSDVMMPEMDGLEFCNAVKTSIEYSHIPLILLTAKGNSEAEIQGIQSGADAYIMKPFKWKYLLAVVKNLIDSRGRLQKKFSDSPQTGVNDITNNQKDKEFIEKIVAIIEKRMIDPQLSVEELSKDMSMSRSTLHKKIKAMVGMGPNELIRLVRLKQAARMLLTGQNNISEVSYLAGFSSPSYFSKCFLQQFKMTPKEYTDKQSTSLDLDIDNLL
ncbi:MAG: response regulator [Pseudarcicella sp.]|nr:response regulator [Pseudarcicella sp.]